MTNDILSSLMQIYLPPTYHLWDVLAHIFCKHALIGLFGSYFWILKVFYILDKVLFQHVFCKYFLQCKIFYSFNVSFQSGKYLILIKSNICFCFYKSPFGVCKKLSSNPRLPRCSPMSSSRNVILLCSASRSMIHLS